MKPEKSRLERIPFFIVAERLSKLLNTPIYVGHVNILVRGWNSQRERHGKSPINFAQRVKDEVAWQKAHGLPVNRERFFFNDELELFSRYVGYDLTQNNADNQ